MQPTNVEAKHDVALKAKKTFSSQLNEFAGRFSFGHGHHAKSASSSAGSSRSSLTKASQTSAPGNPSSAFDSFDSGDELDHHIADWSKHGFETLPDKPGYRLVSLWSTPSSSLYSLHRSFSSRSSVSSRSSSFYSNPDVDSYGRFIPALVNFRLEWTGPVPRKQATFDLTALNPCFLQEGDYQVNLKWLSDTSGEYVPMAATKNLVVKSKSHALAKTTGENHVGFNKTHGPASLIVTKEGWMYRAKDRQQAVRVTVDYTPPIEWSSWSDSDFIMSPWSSRPSSRASSFSSNTNGGAKGNHSSSSNGSRPSSVPALPPIPASPANPQVTCSNTEDLPEVSASVPIDEAVAQRSLVFKTPSRS